MPKFNPLYRLNTYTTNLFINVKVVRLWKVLVHPRGSPSIELILGDEESDKVHATIPPEFVCYFKDRIKEGGSYVFCKFQVKEVKEEIQKTDGPYRIVFTDKTWFEDSEYPIKANLFTKTSFKKVLEGKVFYKWSYVDLVGIITKIEEIQSFDNDHSSNRWELEKRYLRFTIRDIEGLEISCFATGIYANEIFCKCKLFKVNIKTCLFKLWKVVEVGDTYQLTNGNGISDFIINPRVEEFEDFYRVADVLGIATKPIDTFHEFDDRYRMEIGYNLADYQHPYVEDKSTNQRIPG